MRTARRIGPGKTAGILSALGAGAFALALASVDATAAGRPKGAPDPLAAGIARSSEYLKNNASKDEFWLQIKGACEPVLSTASQALREGRRFFALQALARVWPNLGGSEYVESRPAASLENAAALESDWSSMGKTLRADLARSAPGAWDGVHPAAVRAIGEASVRAVRSFYESALAYGRSTTPQSGYFYLGAARAERDLARLCRKISADEPSSPAAPPPPALRSLHGELDALETELLSAYRPPASIDRHAEFIAASSALKEARELDAAGLRYGALLRYLSAVQRCVPLLSSGAGLERAELTSRLQALDARLSAKGVDHSLGRLFWDGAQSDLAVSGGDARTAGAIVQEVLPRYFAALKPAEPEKPKAAPLFNVTLVRWPYT